MTFPQLCGLAVLAVGLGWLLRTAGCRTAAAIPLAGGILFGALALARLGEPIAYLRELGRDAGADDLTALLLRILALGCLSSLAGDVCRDAGDPTLGARLETCGRAEILLLLLPLVKELVALAREVAA